MKRFSSVLALAAIASLTACGGGSGSSALPSAPTSPTQMQDVQFRITIPQSVRLSPKYVSSSTQSASISVAPTGGAPLTPVNINCTTTCSGTISAPVGSDLFDVKLYDATNATGNVLSHGSATQTIVAATANTVTLTFGGVVKSIALGSTASTVNAGTPVQIIIAAFDAAGQHIVGTANYDNPITLTNADTSGTTSLNTTNVTSPNTVVTLSYNGASSSVSSAQITGSATGATSGSVSVTKGSGSGAASSVSFLSSGAGSIAASSTAATVVAASEYQTAIGSAPSSVAATAQGNISLQIGTNLTPLDALRHALGTSPAPHSTDDDVMGYRGTFRDSPISDDWNSKYSKNLMVLAPGSIPHTVTKKSTPAIGTVQSFYISSSSIGSSGGGYVNVPFTLQATSAHTAIWMDNSLSPTVMGYANQIATLSENSYLSDTSKYAPFDYTAASTGYTMYGGNYCDNSGASLGTTGPAFIPPPAAGLVNVMVANGAAGGPLGGGVGGYFSSLNYLTQGYANCPSGQASSPSNQLPMIVVGWFSDGSANGDAYALREDLVRGTAHELQHLINFVNHVIINGQARNDPRWLNEGMSVLSQDLVSSGGIDIDDAFNHATAYLTHPQENSVTGFLRIVSGSTPTLAYNCGSCYGASYLFARYMYDRFGGTPGFTQNMTTGSTNGHASLLRISSYADMAPLLGDFATALAVSNTGVSTDPKYNFTGINLHHTYLSPNASLGYSSQVFNGPTLLPLAVGNTASISGMPAGAFAYYNITGLTGSGNAVKLSDTTTGTSPMALAGAIVQH